jgi:DNA-binding NarL/FixJ family response regulator
MNSIRTVIVDDERPACDRLKKLLSAFPRIEVVSSFTNSRQALEYIHKYKPELVFLDIELDHTVSAFDLLEQLREGFYNPHVIMVTAHPQYAIRSIKQEVFDYLLKPVDIDELKDTLERLIARKEHKNQRILKDFGMLSERESQVLNYVLQGKNSQEIADLLFISVNTVHTHRRNILKKSGAVSILDLFRLNNIAYD